GLSVGQNYSGMIDFNSQQRNEEIR
ncbi:MAG: hypothetical protein JWO91_2540, partial [Acidobacteriaceae bacterium]|nr:hypothetical protein [Acidobacteriaceae bacterium]